MNPTARAIDLVIANWHVAGWQQIVREAEENRTPSLAGSSGEDSPSLAGWGNAAITRRLGANR